MKLPSPAILKLYAALGNAELCGLLGLRFEPKGTAHRHWDIVSIPRGNYTSRKEMTDLLVAYGFVLVPAEFRRPNAQPYELDPYPFFVKPK